MRKCLMTILLGALLFTLSSAWAGAQTPVARDASKAAVSASPRAAQNRVTIRISNFNFEPKQVTVPAGATVVWVNEAGRHTVEADKGEFKSPVLTQGKSFEFKFDKPGRYAYHCGFHGESGGKDMAGTVVVTRKK